MNNIVPNEQNQRISIVQEELKRLLSIIMYTVENSNDETLDFDYIISNSDNPEEIKTAKFLKQDNLDRENRINESEKTNKANKNKEKQSEKLVNEPIIINHSRENEQITTSQETVERNKDEGR